GNLSLDGNGLEGVQFVHDQSRSHSAEHRARVPRTDRQLLDTEANPIEQLFRWFLFKLGMPLKPQEPRKEKLKGGWTVCPYCDTPAEPGLRFCMNCKHQFLSSQEMAKLKVVQAANEADTTLTMDGAKGFSKRAKATTGAGGGLATVLMQRGLLVVILLALGYAGYMALSNDQVMSEINRMVTSMNISTHTASTREARDTASGAHKTDDTHTASDDPSHHRR
ncbi:MAG: hypothetical protein ACRD3W_03610, partial [Terriglobales bacterium]